MHEMPVRVVKTPNTLLTYYVDAIAIAEKEPALLCQDPALQQRHPSCWHAWPRSCTGTRLVLKELQALLCRPLTASFPMSPFIPHRQCVHQTKPPAALSKAERFLRLLRTLLGLGGWTCCSSLGCLVGSAPVHLSAQVPLYRQWCASTNDGQRNFSKCVKASVGRQIVRSNGRLT